MFCLVSLMRGIFVTRKETRKIFGTMSTLGATWAARKYQCSTGAWRHRQRKMKNILRMTPILGATGSKKNHRNNASIGSKKNHQGSASGWQEELLVNRPCNETGVCCGCNNRCQARFGHHAPIWSLDPIER